MPVDSETGLTWTRRWPISDEDRQRLITDLGENYLRYLLIEQRLRELRPGILRSCAKFILENQQWQRDRWESRDHEQALPVLARLSVSAAMALQGEITYDYYASGANLAPDYLIERSNDWLPLPALPETV